MGRSTDGPIQRTWSELKAGKPGSRFREYYKRSRSGHHGALRKAVVIVAGSALTVAGMVLLVLPGPGVVVIALGGALIAKESYLAATTLDLVERGSRRVIRRLLVVVNDLAN
jgi:hypothetical protein